MRDRITAGDSLDFLTSVPDYPASAGYTLFHRFVPRAAGAATPIGLTSVPEGDDYRTVLADTDTAAWVAGDYSWHSWVAKPGERHNIDSGTLTIDPDPATVDVLDNRSNAQRNLDAIEAFLGGKATSAVREYEINGRRLVNYQPADLIALADYFRRQVANENVADRLASGLGNPRRLYVRFGRA